MHRYGGFHTEQHQKGTKKKKSKSEICIYNGWMVEAALHHGRSIRYNPNINDFEC